MSAEINLLPSKGQNKKLSKPEKLARRLTYASFFVFFVFIIFLAGANFLFSNTLKKLNAGLDVAKENIVYLEETEQKFILAKDRVEKISRILDQREVEKKFNKQKVMIDNFGPSMDLKRLYIDNSEAKTEVVARNSKDLVSFMSQLVVHTGFNTIVLDSLQFNPINGYTAVIHFE